MGLGGIRSYRVWVYTVKSSPKRGYRHPRIHPTLLTTLKHYRPSINLSNIPVVLVALAGNHLIVSAAIYTDSIYVDKLLSIDLRFGPHAPENAPHAACVFSHLTGAHGVSEICTKILRQAQVRPLRLTPCGPTLRPIRRGLPKGFQSASSFPRWTMPRAQRSIRPSSKKKTRDTRRISQG